MSEIKSISSTPFSRIVSDAVMPMLKRPPRLQVAALCTRDGPDGLEVLMITSRGTGRWILPKGWPMPHRSLAEAAAQEAWEEAGVRGRVDAAPLGDYAAQKDTDGGLAVPCRVTVFRLHVESLVNSFPEATRRNRRWFRPAEAATLVREPELRDLLMAL